MNICDRMKPCNKNSECIFFKKNNTFTCRCFNGANSCDEDLNNEQTTLDTTQLDNIKQIQDAIVLNESSEQQIQESSLSSYEYTMLNLNTNANRLKDDKYRIDKQDGKFSAEQIPSFGFNYDNLYILLPVGLVAIIIIIFLSIVIYVGVKAR